uniref:phosphatidylinositol-3,4,5-trisphosphate 5-phosphatase n=1 Tax=Latimeria chalumnae TaxID=7897 RepID=H3AZW7_LATCH
AGTMSMAPWYHWDISRVRAEDLLAKAGKDGSFLVRDSESVPGAYALCLLFQRQVHTYRILPDEEGLLAVQTTQGAQIKCFQTLNDLIATYQQPHKGLVTPLLFPVRQEETPEEGSDDLKTRTYDTALSCPTVPSQASRAQISQLLQQRLQEQSSLSSPSEFLGLLSEYLKTNLQLDLETMKSGTPKLWHLNKALGVACKGLHSELDFTLSSLETLVKVFDHPNSPMAPQKKQTPRLTLENLISKISTLNNLLSSLEKKVLNALQETVSHLNLALPNTPAGTSPASKTIPVQNFEVKLGKSQRASLTVDVEGGKVILKKLNSSVEELISHEKILQLIKYQNSQNKLRFVFDKEGQKNQQRDFIFENARVSNVSYCCGLNFLSVCPTPHCFFPTCRKKEGFCQLLQLMRMKHSNLDEPDMISLYIGTWNMGGALPPKNIASWLQSKGLGKTQDETTTSIPQDVYVIGSQENPLGDREWTEFLRAAIKSVTETDVKLVAIQSLWNIKLTVLVKVEHENRISHVNTSSVKTGIANTLGNKGAVGMSFLFNGTSFGFVNCHLTSGTEKTHRLALRTIRHCHVKDREMLKNATIHVSCRRNQNYHDIIRSLLLGDKQLSAFDTTLRFTHLFWFGDLNYRLDMDVQDILNHIHKKDFETLLSVDQLNLEKEKNKVFLRFNEEEINFPPTYRYERGSRDSYMWQKVKATGVRVNVPSWCDRILWKSYPETHIVCNSYGCPDDIVTSDHSPVFATFEVGVTSQFVSNKDPGCRSEEALIEFETIEAIVKACSRAKFFIEFHSSCLEDFKKSWENNSQSSDIPGFLKLGWSATQLPMVGLAFFTFLLLFSVSHDCSNNLRILNPILSEMEYLLDQHLLLTVKSVDGYESYGTYNTLNAY